MPSNQSPLGALPARFRRPRVLIVGCGDVGVRVAQHLPPRVRVIALTSTPARTAELRATGVLPLLGNLDQPASLRRLAGLATQVLHLAPPPAQGVQDPRTAALLQTLRRRSLPAVLVYGSTSGVYGDCAGDLVPETRMPRPVTPRGRRRVAAEQAVRFFGRSAKVRSSVLRIPGIYAEDRAGGSPRERLEKGLPVLLAAQDVHTNHIHADDLARACIAALWRGASQRIYHVSDDSQLKMGDYFDLAAAMYGLPFPPRVSWAEAQTMLSPMQLSFMGESRRLANLRLKSELRLRLRYPTVADGLHSRSLSKVSKIAPK